MTDLWTEPCPKCDRPCEPCTDDYDNPAFNSWGLGHPYYCKGEECGRHFWDRRRKPKKFLEEKPEEIYEQPVEER